MRLILRPPGRRNETKAEFAILAPDDAGVAEPLGVILVEPDHGLPRNIGEKAHPDAGLRPVVDLAFDQRNNYLKTSYIKYLRRLNRANFLLGQRLGQHRHEFHGNPSPRGRPLGPRAAT